MSLGSSPLARGLLAGLVGGLGVPGIIPARAGFTAPGRAPWAAPADHPRSRGVYCPVLGGGPGQEGSSPLARGLPSRPTRGWPRTRIIPARAGFTPAMLVSVRIGWDHPRSRGVYYAGGAGAGLRLGSSPLARGLRAVDSPAPPRLRIIPARAGFTAPSSSTPTESPDHPRSRGVYSRTDRGLTSRVGSSPLARGLLPDGPGIDVEGGIIPARAGFTAGPAVMVRRGADHPRSRGVYRGRRCRVGRSQWIIPARAGFTPPGVDSILAS